MVPKLQTRELRLAQPQIPQPKTTPSRLSLPAALPIKKCPSSDPSFKMQFHKTLSPSQALNPRPPQLQVKTQQSLHHKPLNKLNRLTRQIILRIFRKYKLRIQVRIRILRKITVWMEIQIIQRDKIPLKTKLSRTDRAIRVLRRPRSNLLALPPQLHPL